MLVAKRGPASGRDITKTEIRAPFMLGLRLKLAREGRGLTQGALAAKLGGGFSPRLVSMLEHDRANVAPAQIFDLARALDVPYRYLDAAGADGLRGLSFRTKGAASHRELAIAQAKALDVVDRHLALEEALDAEKVWVPPAGAPYVAVTRAEAISAAKSVREAWGLGTGPLGDLSAVLEKRGIYVVRVALEKIHGILGEGDWGDERPTKVILVNSNVGFERQRFTLAHELAHLVLLSAPDSVAERVADQFASAFLMPDEALASALGQRTSRVEIASLRPLSKKFGISLPALITRCMELEFVDRAGRDRLFADLRSQGGETVRPRPAPDTFADDTEHFKAECLDAIRKGTISPSYGAELMNRTEWEVLELLAVSPVVP